MFLQKEFLKKSFRKLLFWLFKKTLWEDSLYLLFKFTLIDVKFNIICHVVTCTGQERFLSTREYVLDGADGSYLANLALY